MSDGFAGDTCLSLFKAVWDTGALDWPQGSRVLEIGCAEGDWMTPMRRLRPDLQIVGIDWRCADPRPCEVIRADVLTHDWPWRTFDVVVGISSIEHIGLGHYDHDPIAEDGDRHCMERVVRWLKPGGQVYLDVPYGNQYTVCGTAHRVYDDAAIASRLLVPGLRETRRWYSLGGGHGLHDTPLIRPETMSYVALVARKES